MKRIFTLATLCSIVAASSACAFQSNVPVEVPRSNLSQAKESLELPAAQTNLIVAQLAQGQDHAADVERKAVIQLVSPESVVPETGDLQQASDFRETLKRDPYLTHRPKPEDRWTIKDAQWRTDDQETTGPVEVVVRDQATEETVQLDGTATALEQRRKVEVDSLKPIVVADTVKPVPSERRNSFVPPVPLDQSNPFVTVEQSSSLVEGVEHMESTKQTPVGQAVDQSSAAAVARPVETSGLVERTGAVGRSVETSGVSDVVVTQVTETQPAVTNIEVRTPAVEGAITKTDAATSQSLVTPGSVEPSRSVEGSKETHVVSKEVAPVAAATQRQAARRKKAGFGWWSVLGLALLPLFLLAGIYGLGSTMLGRSRSDLWEGTLSPTTSAESATAKSLGTDTRRSTEASRVAVSEVDTCASETGKSEVCEVAAGGVGSHGLNVNGAQSRATETCKAESRGVEPRDSGRREVRGREVRGREVESRDERSRDEESLRVESRPVESHGFDSCEFESRGSKVREAESRSSESREVPKREAEARTETVSDAEARRAESRGVGSCDVGSRTNQTREVESCEIESQELETCNVESRQSENRKPRTRGVDSSVKKTAGGNKPTESSDRTSGSKKVAAASGKGRSRDDFTTIGGIDRESQQALYDAGYLRFSDLANASRKQLRQVFDGHRRKFKSSELNRWSKQAALAARGEVASAERPVAQQVRDKQASPTSSRSGLSRSASSVSNMSGADDLKKIRGIGPVTQRVLFDCGITRFEQIAQMTSEEISDLFADQKNRFRLQDASTWPEQARSLAAQRSDDDNQDIAVLEEINELRAMVSGANTTSDSKKRVNSKAK